MLSNAYYGPTWHEWESKVTMNGVETDLVSWEVERSFTGIPQSSDNSARGATGKIKPVSPRDVLSYAPHPWVRAGVLPPKPGWPVTIEVRPKPRRDNDPDVRSWVRVFTGVVDDVSGDDFADLTVTVVDVLDPFTRLVTLPPLLFDMPPRPENPGGAKIKTALHLSYYIHSAFEAARFSASLPMTPSARLRVPMFGSTLPQPGKITSCIPVSRADEDDPEFKVERVAEFGYGINGFAATYVPEPYYVPTPTIQTFLFRVPLNVSTGGYTITLNRAVAWEKTVITIRQDRWVLVDVNDTRVLALGPTELGRVAQLSWDGTRMSLRSQPSGATAPVSRSTLHSGTSRVLSVQVGSPRSDTPVGGFALYDGIPADSDLPWQPNALIPYTNWMPTWHPAGRAVEGLQAASVLDQIAKAMVCHWGIDELGRVVWRSAISAMLYYIKGPTITDSEIMDHIGWQADSTMGASAVVTRGEWPQWGASQYPVHRVYTGSAITLQAGETREEFIHSPAEEDWIQVDTVGETGVAMGTGTVKWGSTKDLRSTRFIASRASDTDDNPVVATLAEYTATLEELDAKSWKLTQRAPTNVSVTTKTGSWPELNPALRNKDMPVVNAYGRILWRDLIEQSETVGPPLAPVYELDWGEWGYLARVALREVLVDLLAWDVYEFDKVEIVPDLRLQVGDRATFDLNESMRLEADIFIKKMRYSFTADGGLTQFVDTRIMAGRTPSATYEMLEDSWSIPTREEYQELETKWADGPYKNFEELPLS